jgi:hypothetical protein
MSEEGDNTMTAAEADMVTTAAAVPEEAVPEEADTDWMEKYPEGAKIDGGRRRSRKNRGAKKGKTRKGNKMLSSWVAFVKKVQHEEKISYSDAMKRASARKKEWKMGQMGGYGESMSVIPSMPMSMSVNKSKSMGKGMNKSKSQNQSQYGGDSDSSSGSSTLEGGRRRRKQRRIVKRRGSKKRGSKRRGSRRSRR